MAISVSVTKDKKRKQEYDAAYSMGFDDDGYYWFLYSFFENVYEKTGLMIDLYGYAEFDALNLPILKNELEKARKFVTQQSGEEWLVKVGTQIAPVQKEL